MKPVQRPPAWLIAPAIIGVVLLALPLVALAWRAPWKTIGTILRGDAVVDALLLSLLVSSIAAGLCLVLGIPLAWMLARTAFPGRRIVRAIVLLPMVLPPVVVGTALLFALSPRRGLIGPTLDDWFGIQLPFTTAGAVLAATAVALPFFVVAVEAALRNDADDLEGAAATLGASPSMIFRRVTLPKIAPAIGAGLALSWARALGEFGATLTFAGNVPGETQTLPLATFLSLESGDGDAAVALSLLLLAVSLVVLVGLRDRWFSR